MHSPKPHPGDLGLASSRHCPGGDQTGRQTHLGPPERPGRAPCSLQAAPCHLCLSLAHVVGYVWPELAGFHCPSLQYFFNKTASFFFHSGAEGYLCCRNKKLPISSTQYI